MFLRYLILLAIAWSSMRIGSMFIPLDELSFNQFGDYVTLFIMRPLNILIFLLMNLFAVLLLRYVMLNSLQMSNQKGLSSNKNKLTGTLILLFSLYILVIFILRSPIIVLTIMGIIILFDLRRWFKYRKSRLKMKQYFREFS